jgi:hypothetical protein
MNAIKWKHNQRIIWDHHHMMNKTCTLTQTCAFTRGGVLNVYMYELIQFVDFLYSFCPLL